MNYSIPITQRAKGAVSNNSNMSGKQMMRLSENLKSAADQEAETHDCGCGK